MLLDVEGTTTPIDFVHTTLFGYARARVNAFLQQHWDEPEVRADITGLRAEHAGESSDPAPPAWRDDPTAVTSYVHWLMDRDRKSTGLKSLQGKIWEEGYRSGRLRGEVYPDVPPALKRWRSAEVAVAIFSSGSIQAQRSLFRNSTAGDLTHFIQGHFDTTTGPKGAPESYARIATALGRSPSDVLFVSDVAAELDAARKAGMRTALSVRGPDSPGVSAAHPVVRSFDQLP